MTPVTGLTAPRTEWNGSLILGRILNTNIPYLHKKTCWISMIGHSQCTVSASQSVTTVLGPYFANMILEIKTTRN